MKASQNLSRLGPRIKLFRRHMQELSALLIHQSQVRLLTREHDDQQEKYYPRDRVIAIQRITDQAFRISDLMSRQSADRQQMRGRHQQEELALEQTMDTINQTSHLSG